MKNEIKTKQKGRLYSENLIHLAKTINNLIKKNFN